MAVGVEVAAVLGIAMPEACGGEALTIVIDDHRAEHYLVASVHVDIGNAVVVVTLRFPWTIGIAGPAPALGQRMGARVYIISNHLVACVDASRKEYAGLVPVQVGGTDEVLRTTMSVAVAPSAVQVGLALL